MKVEVKNWDNEVTGKIELPDSVFARKVNQHLVWEVVRAYLASRRRGTHKTKERSEVRGTGSKPWRQKHTGRARAGSRQSPLWRSGGVVHGPRPRSYAQKVNKRVTVKNSLVVKVDADRNLLFLKGGVPGARNSYIRIVKAS